MTKMQLLKFLATCICWYLSSAITNNIGKEILGIISFPVTLTIIQFGFLAVFSFIYGTFVTKDLQPISKQILVLTFPLSLFQIAGHIFSTVALTYVTVSFSHTIKVYLCLF
jgi:solute carrier family 35 protein E1